MRNSLHLHVGAGNANINSNDVDLVRNLIEAGEYSFALEKIRKLMYEYPDSPAPHNLLGVYYEYLRDKASAQRHYRAALAIRPGYESAQSNLQRVTSFDPSCSWQVDFGFGKRSSNKSAKLRIGENEKPNGSILFAKRI